jgi:hypothetical protein
MALRRLALVAEAVVAAQGVVAEARARRERSSPAALEQAK